MDLLTLQASRKPFKVITGKRAYENMLVAELRTETNSGLEYSVVADIQLREIILVRTQTIPYSQNPENTADPTSSTTTTATGQKAVVPSTLTSTQLDNAGINPPSGMLWGSSSSTSLSESVATGGGDTSIPTTPIDYPTLPSSPNLPEVPSGPV